MEQGLQSRTYLSKPRGGRAWLSVLVALLGLGAVAWAITQATSLSQLFDPRSALIVGVGTFATTLLQYDARTLWTAIMSVLRSMWSALDNSVLETRREVDEAIVQNAHLTTLRDGEKITGELLNDVVYMYHRGLIFEEIDQFVSARIEDEHNERRVSAELLRRAALTAPALGLFGTVLGLMGVLRTMDNPSQIGPLMALALMTTAYGAGLGSLVFTPLAGRLEHANNVFLENHRQLLSRIAILLTREEREMNVTHTPRLVSDEAPIS